MGGEEDLESLGPFADWGPQGAVQGWTEPAAQAGQGGSPGIPAPGEERRGGAGWARGRGAAARGERGGGGRVSEPAPERRAL